MGAKIEKVMLYEDNPEELLIQLDNGCDLLLTLRHKINSPPLAEYRELAPPKTDGERILWPNGESLSIDKIMDILRM